MPLNNASLAYPLEVYAMQSTWLKLLEAFVCQHVICLINQTLNLFYRFASTIIGKGVDFATEHNSAKTRD